MKEDGKTSFTLLMIVDRQPVEVTPGGSGKKPTRNTSVQDERGMMHGTSHSLGQEEGENEEGGLLN